MCITAWLVSFQVGKCHDIYHPWSGGISSVHCFSCLSLDWSAFAIVRYLILHVLLYSDIKELVMTPHIHSVCNWCRSLSNIIFPPQTALSVRPSCVVQVHIQLMKCEVIRLLSLTLSMQLWTKSMTIYEIASCMNVSHDILYSATKLCCERVFVLGIVIEHLAIINVPKYNISHFTPVVF